MDLKDINIEDYMPAMDMPPLHPLPLAPSMSHPRESKPDFDGQSTSSEENEGKAEKYDSRVPRFSEPKPISPGHPKRLYKDAQAAYIPYHPDHQDLPDAAAIASTRPTGINAFATVARPLLRSVRDKDIRIFLRQEYEYSLYAEANNLPAQPLQSMIDPSFYSVFSRLGLLFACPLPNINLPDPLAHMLVPDDTEFEVSEADNVPMTKEERQAQLALWDRQARCLLHKLARIKDVREDVPMARAEELLKSTVRWDSRLDDFF